MGENLCNLDDVNDFVSFRVDDSHTVIIEHDVIVAAIVGYDDYDVFRNRIEMHGTRKSNANVNRHIEVSCRLDMMP